MRGVVRFVAACAMGVMVIGSASAGVIEDRKQGFKANVDAMKAIKAAVQSGNAKDAVPHAQAIAAFTDKIAGLFPEGSGTGDTRALPKIWEDWAGFEKAIAANKEAALALAGVAATGDAGATGAALKALGASCGGCHKPYRAEKTDRSEILRSGVGRGG